MRSLDYTKATNLIDEEFTVAEDQILQKIVPELDSPAKEASDRVFASNTQAYREVLLGCTIAKILDPFIDIRQPYVDQGANAFSGRSLDEKVINPFLQRRRIPSSRGPYLSVFRRSVRFDTIIRSGLRDKLGYDALLEALTYLENLDEPQIRLFLRYQVFKFAELREASNVPLSRIQRLSLEQCGRLVEGLLSTASGGLLPVLLAVATFRTIKAFFRTDWSIAWQGINVADAASGASGDITISSGGNLVLAIEVTERIVDKSRVVSTFNTKIAVNKIEDYLFFVGAADPSLDAKAQANQYFAQGHELNFINIKGWILMSLATMGKHGRTTFIQEILGLLENDNVPQALKVAWNDNINKLLAT